MKPKLNLTPWFPVKTNPVRTGRYQVELCDFPGARVSRVMLIWDGEDWKTNCGADIAILPTDRWRGMNGVTGSVLRNGVAS